MAIPAKPTQRLAVDGIIGQKTRDAAAWALKVTRFTSGTTIRDMDVSAERSLQRWLNRYKTWKKVPVTSWAHSYYQWDQALEEDGDIGPRTEAKLGAVITYFTNGWAHGPLDDILIPAGRSIRCFQALLNGMIFREQPRGPGIKYVNSSVEWDNRDYRWAHRPGVFG